MRYFKKVLIANRGEIARRIIRTCKRLSISTVAVYSEADAAALFVKEAGEAVLIGPAPVKKSYLDLEAIIQAAKQTGADAIHPGYGFLAENASFAERCTEEGITFIGPSASIIRLMGDKIAARKQMKAAGIQIVPGVDGALRSLEEAPSPFLDSKAREALCAAAVKGAESIGYTNVGTMEFIVDEHGQYYFLEMNTRIQVEHPVTEEISGVDLVEWQLKIAANVPIDRDEIPAIPSGHAIECRVYAEDPRTFMPSPGKIDTLIAPEEARLEFAVTQGDQVTPFYDPMIGKMITHGASRAEAIEKMQQALQQCTVSGIKNNLPLLASIMDDLAFQAGNYNTKFVETLLKG
ncbi:acetyl-CoA carboxylase biotin carboxylase subunit [Brevibacillus reuszeri]|uniref:acetyl-CoA carboxylase biotin carboxylase subunit n=1 Tax=Brevibacillus reuszeri TaxID=54915 RepID=UPI003D24681C